MTLRLVLRLEIFLPWADLRYLIDGGFNMLTSIIMLPATDLHASSPIVRDISQKSDETGGVAGRNVLKFWPSNWLVPLRLKNA